MWVIARDYNLRHVCKVRSVGLNKGGCVESREPTANAAQLRSTVLNADWPTQRDCGVFFSLPRSRRLGLLYLSLPLSRFYDEAGWSVQEWSLSREANCPVLGLLGLLLPPPFGETRGIEKRIAPNTVFSSDNLTLDAHKQG